MPSFERRHGWDLSALVIGGPAMRTETSAGFTLVELLVVIAVIGVLVALLLPAVQAARESARRVQCNNNLKQVQPWPLHNFEQEPTRRCRRIFGLFPEKGTRQAEGGWFVHVLPYIEQGTITDQIVGQRRRPRPNWHARHPGQPRLCARPLGISGPRGVGKRSREPAAPAGRATRGGLTPGRLAPPPDRRWVGPPPVLGPGHGHAPGLFPSRTTAWTR